MVTRFLLLVLGLIHISNGAWMLAAPMSWFESIPGVAETGPLNHHFVTDVGLAFVASGLGFILGSRKGMAAFALAGATWPALHALFHIAEWLENGFPVRPDVAITDVVGVVLVGALGAFAAWRNARREGTI